MRVRLTNRHCRFTLNGAVKAAPSPSREEFSFRDTRCDNRARNVSSQEMLAVVVNIIIALVVVALLKYDDLHSCLFIPIAGDYASHSEVIARAFELLPVTFVDLHLRARALASRS